MLSSVLINISLCPFRRGGETQKTLVRPPPGTYAHRADSYAGKAGGAHIQYNRAESERLEVHIHLTSKEEKNVLEEKEKHLLCNATLV